MTKVTLSDVTGTQNQTSLAATINANHDAIIAAVENTLSLDGTSPNAMEADFDMNSNKIINVADGTNAHEAINKGQLDDIVLTGVSFDDSANPASLGASALPGTSVYPARGDHVHPIPQALFDDSANPTSLGATALPGTSIYPARSDHVHPIPQALFDAKADIAVIQSTLTGLTSVTVPATFMRIKTTGYSTAGRGAAEYVRSTAGACASYPSSAYKQSADGAYWLIDSEVFRPEMFGAVGDGSFSTSEHTAGTDNSTAFTHTRQAAATAKKSIFVSAPYRINAASAIFDSKVHIFGYSKEHGFIIPVYATDTGFWDKAGCRFEGFRIHVCTMEAKAANQGHLQCNITTTNKGYFIGLTNNDDGVSGFHYENLNLTRKSVGGGGGSGIIMVGNAHKGYINNINDDGSYTGHTYLVASHWSGKGDAYGSTVTKTWHPHDINIGSLSVTNCAIAIGLSSSYNIFQSGLVSMVGGNSVIYLLPGDETDTLTDTTVHPAGSIGKNITLRGPFAHHTPTGTSKSVILYSQGTSPGPWRYMPLDGAVGFMSDLDMEIRIGDVTLFRATASSQGLLDVSYFRGTLEIGELKNTGSSVVDNAIYITYSQAGSIVVKKLSGTFNNRPIYLGSVSFFKLLDSDTTTIANSGSTDVTVYCFGGTEAATVSGAHSIGATTLVLSSGITTRMSRNTPITIGSNTVYTTAYNPVGVSHIPVTALPAALAGGEAVTLDHRNRGIHLHLKTRGGYYGCDIGRTTGVITGHNIGSLSAMRIRNSSYIDLNGFVFESSTSSDLIITNTTNFVKAVGCVFGLNAPSTLAYNVLCSTAETWKRFVGIGCSFLNYTTSYISASSVNDWTIIGSTSKTGTNIAANYT